MSSSGFHCTASQTSQKTDTRMRGGDVRCTSIILSIESCYRFRQPNVPSSGMANEKPKAPPEGKFAETMRKSREKRASMTEQSQQRAQSQEESIQLEEAKRADHISVRVRNSEN